MSMDKKFYLVLSVRDINALHAAAHRSMNSPHGRSPGDPDRENHCVVLNGIEAYGGDCPDQLSDTSFRDAVRAIEADTDQAFAAAGCPAVLDEEVAAAARETVSMRARRVIAERGENLPLEFGV